MCSNEYSMVKVAMLFLEDVIIKDLLIFMSTDDGTKYLSSAIIAMVLPIFVMTQFTWFFQERFISYVPN